MGRRRRFLRALGGAAAWIALSGHSPYRQFQIYRKTRLIILHTRSDARAASLADALAALFAKHWPDSQAITARARDSVDLVKLIKSAQLDVALLSAAEAAAARQGIDAFARSGKTSLAVLAQIGGHLLLTREDLLEPVARKVVSALSSHWEELDAGFRGEAPSPEPGAGLGVPLHTTAAALYRSATTRKPAS